MSAQLATRDCRVCGAPFDPINRRHKVCSEACAIALPGVLREEEQRKRWARDARDYRRKNAERQKGNHGQDGRFMSARKAINAFVRERDHALPCIVHGHDCPHSEFHGGHFVGVEIDGALRFNLWNIHKQCAASNKGARYRKKFRDTTGPKFEANLIERIGQERVDWLNGKHAEREYSDAYLSRLASVFRRRARLYADLRARRSAALRS